MGTLGINELNNLEKQPFRGVLRKSVLKIFSNFAREHPCRSASSIKLLYNFIEIALRHGRSLVNLLLFLHLYFCVKKVQFKSRSNYIWYWSGVLDFKKSLKIVLFNLFSTNAPLLCPLKTSENWRFPDDFSGYRSGTLVENELRKVQIKNRKTLSSVPFYPVNLIDCSQIFDCIAHGLY